MRAHTDRMNPAPAMKAAFLEDVNMVMVWGVLQATYQEVIRVEVVRERVSVAG